MDAVKEASDRAGGCAALLRTQSYYDGRWVGGQEQIAVSNPASGAPVGLGPAP